MRTYLLVLIFIASWLGLPKSAAAQPDQKKLACVTAAEQGQVARDQGRLLEARKLLLDCASDACPSVVSKSCTHWLSELTPRIPSIVLRVVDGSQHDRTDAQVQLDGEPIPLDGRPIVLDPGVHHIVVSAPSAQPTEQTILAVEREIERLVRVHLQPTAAAPKAPNQPSLRIPTGAWIAGAAGVLAFGSFAYFAVAASNDLADLKRTCAQTCTDAETRAGRSQALAAQVSLGVGVAALAGAAIWTLLAQERAPRSNLSVAFVPTPDGAVAWVRADL